MNEQKSMEQKRYYVEYDTTEKEKQPYTKVCQTECCNNYRHLFFFPKESL